MQDPSVYNGRKPAIGPYALLSSGKVRDIYAVDDDHLLFVTSDRVSAFDVIMPRGIPNKGRVLTSIAEFWFGRTADVLPNHLVSTRVEDLSGLDAEQTESLRGRVMLIRRCQPTTVEWVVRGYLAGSGWKEYQQSGSVCGVELPAGLGFCEALPEPILTPTTKEEAHDRPLSAAEASDRVGGDLFRAAHDASLRLFQRGTDVLSEIGILLADTKFEFGLDGDRLVLIDEALTPDSSRFWPADQYKIGVNQPSYDKQVLRDWLESTDWNKEAPGPALPDELVERVSNRYLAICEKLTGQLPAGLSL